MIRRYLITKDKNRCIIYVPFNKEKADSDHSIKQTLKCYKGFYIFYKDSKRAQTIKFFKAIERYNIAITTRGRGVDYTTLEKIKAIELIVVAHGHNEVASLFCQRVGVSVEDLWQQAIFLHLYNGLLQYTNINPFEIVFLSCYSAEVFARRFLDHVVKNEKRRAPDSIVGFTCATTAGNLKYTRSLYIDSTRDNSIEEVIEKLDNMVADADNYTVNETALKDLKEKNQVYTTDVTTQLKQEEVYIVDAGLKIEALDDEYEIVLTQCYSFFPAGSKIITTETKQKKEDQLKKMVKISKKDQRAQDLHKKKKLFIKNKILKNKRRV